MPSSMSGSWKPPVILVLLLLGSSVEAEPPPTNGGQGTKLHGSGVMEDINIPLSTADIPEECEVTLQQGKFSLRCQRREDEGKLVGLRFSVPFAGEVALLFIKEARPHAPSNTLTEYKVEWRLKGAGAGTRPLCKTTNGWALAVPNAWSTGGELIENPNYFTFACVPDNVGESLSVRGGVIVKCIDWGYPPWSSSEGQQDLALQLHQACVRMATADFCGEGRANTLDGTPILFGMPKTIEALRRMAEDPNPDRSKHLEAIWKTDSRGRVRATCLGQKRWHSFSLDGACAGPALRDNQPLVNRCEKEFPVLSAETLVKANVLLVSYSNVPDLLLVTFKHPSGQLLTTRRTIEIGGSHKPDSSIKDPMEYTALRVEGTILEKKPETYKGAAQTLKLYRCRNKKNAAGHRGFYLYPGGETEAHCLDPEESKEALVEGFIYAPSTELPKVKPLTLWKHKTLGSYVTSTRAPRPEADYQDMGVLGYLPAMPRAAVVTPEP